MKLIKINKVKINPNNPRVIKDHKYKMLLNSVKESPAFMQINSLKLDEDFMLLAGNMRHRVCKELGWNEVPVNIFTRDMAEQNNKERLANGLKEASYEEQCKEFTIKDNVSFGEWEWDQLANEWDNGQLQDWGMDVWSTTDEEELEDFFEESEDPQTKEEKNQTVWADLFIDYVQQKDQELYNKASKYADENQ